jgi:hypothetical protein
MKSKRSPNVSPLTSPHIKHPKIRSPSATQTKTMANISEGTLQRFRDGLQELQDSSSDKKDDLILAHAYGFILQIEGFIDDEFIKDHKLVAKDQFTKGVHRQQILEVLTNVAKVDINRENMKSIIYHGMCFTFGVNLVMNIRGLDAFWKNTSVNFPFKTSGKVARHCCLFMSPNPYVKGGVNASRASQNKGKSQLFQSSSSLNVIQLLRLPGVPNLSISTHLGV